METSVPAESPPRLHSPIPEVEWKVQTSFPKARSPGPTSAVGEVLDGDHWSAFNRAVSNVLATEVAEFVLAQLIDGLPVGDVARKSVGWLSRDHPIREHTTLCDGVLERTKAWIAKFSPSVLKMEDRVNIPTLNTIMHPTTLTKTGYSFFRHFGRPPPTLAISTCVFWN